MKLLEHQGKQFLSSWDIPVPRGIVVKTKEKAKEAFHEFNGKAVLKIQVPVGGRGKAGGVKLVNSINDIDEFFAKWQGRDFKSFPVETFLIEEILNIKSEMYISIALNPKAGGLIFIFSREGGVDIEEVAEKTPEKVLKLNLKPTEEYKEYYFRKELRKFGLKGKILTKLSRLAEKLYLNFKKNDLMLVEINPLVIVEKGEIFAADSKIEVDDSGIFRHKQFQEFRELEYITELEKEAQDIGVTYVKLDGDIGIIASGAGLAMETIDLVNAAGYKSANFLETGGGITKELIHRSVHLVTKDKNVRAVIVSLYGGVNPLVEAAKGLVSGKQSLDRDVLIIAKALGNQQEECWKILEEAGIPILKNHRSEDIVEVLKQRLEVAS
ncbi:MAG: succinyl-CoA synthetase beta subunit [Clostridia bacterium]|nr:succinyl-CoA synthetase beta subunit [Clostridia bacterium]